jgi:hypothetical protein
MRRLFSSATFLFFACAALAAVPRPSDVVPTIDAPNSDTRLSVRASAKQLKTVTVRCDKGESLQSALDVNDGPVVIEVRGLCRESVQILRRDDVTLTGQSAATDGLRGTGAEVLLEARDAQRIVLENLSFGGGRRGVLFMAARGEIRSCAFDDNVHYGLFLDAMSDVRASEISIQRNGAVGLFVSGHSYFSCQSCDLVDNGMNTWNRGAAMAYGGGELTMWDTVVAGPKGLMAWGPGSYADVDCYYGDPAATHPCLVDTAGPAATAWHGGEVGFLSTIVGGRLGATHSKLLLMGVTHTRGLVVLEGRSELTVSGGWTKEGAAVESRLKQTLLKDYSRALVQKGTRIVNSVQCSEAADAIRAQLAVTGGPDVLAPVVVDPGVAVTGCPGWTP